MTLSIASRLADFITATEATPLPIRAKAAAPILDCLGVTAAGVSTEVGAAIRRQVLHEGGSPSAPLMGSTQFVPPRAAALANGTLSHALDFDDDDPLLMVGHPTAPVVSALMALSSTVRPSGGHFVDAYVRGVEVEFALGKLANPGHYDLGWHATSTLGTFGAAAAGAYLLALDGQQCRWALGIAASNTAGLKRNFGSHTKPLHVGIAAQAGVMSALLAADGFTANTDIFDGPFNWFDVAGTGPTTIDATKLDSLGTGYWLDTPGINIKRYPSCSNTHPAIDAVLDIMAERRLRPEDVATIECRVAPGTENQLQYPDPGSGLEAKFSLQYCLAVAAVHGVPDIDHFTDTAVKDAQVQALRERVQMVLDPALRRTSEGSSTSATAIITDASGVAHTKTAWTPRGSRDTPLAKDELRSKFLRCSGSLLGTSAGAVFDALYDIDSHPDIATVFEQFATEVHPPQ